MKIHIFPGKYHQNGGFSMAMLVYRSVFPIGKGGFPFAMLVWLVFVAPS